MDIHPETGQLWRAGLLGAKLCFLEDLWQHPYSWQILDLMNLRDVIFVEDMNFFIQYVSPSVTSLFGYSVEEFKKLKKKQFMTPDAFDQAMQKFHEYSFLAQADPDFVLPLMEFEYLRKNGSTFWGELKVNFIRDSKSRLVGCQGILRDIDDRRQMEKSLRQSDQKLRTLFDMSPQAMVLTHLETGRLVDVNERFCQLTHYCKEELLGKSATELGFYSTAERSGIVQELCESEKVVSRAMNFTVKDGTVLDTQMYARQIDLDNEPHIIAVFNDRTHEKQLERQFVQAQKMVPIGNLAAGIAHDFNNLLMGIEGNVSIMRLGLETTHPYQSHLLGITEMVKNCTQLTQQLLGYARKGKNEIGILELNSLIQETSTSFQRARKQITVRTALDPGLYPIHGDAVQMQQILYNLLVNAADAMPKGGELTLSSINVDCQSLIARNYQPKKAKYASIIVADTGIGMDQQTLDHLFEPFFTTKEIGKGTGLGLASVYGIVKEHGGYIDVRSELGQGTTFTLYFPATIEKIVTPTQTQAKLIRASGTILMVDDEPNVLETCSQMLEIIGFRVLTAPGGAQAVEIFKTHHTEIDLVILDLIMPGMDGGTVYDKIKALSPNVKVLLSSGYGLDDRIAAILKKGCLGFIQKPYNIHKLSEKINELRNAS